MQLVTFEVLPEGERGTRGLAARAVRYLAVMAVVTAAQRATAATITVNPGQSIQSAINSAASGDTVVVNAGDYWGGITINKAITVQGQAGAKIRATTAGTGQGVTIASDNCKLIGFYIDSFNIAIGVANVGSMSGFKNGVTIKNNHTYQSQFSCWIGGTNWLVEGNDFERVRWWNGQGDADYTRMFGTGHVFRGNYLHGTNFSNTDLAPATGTDYAHCDGIQYYGNNGEVLKSCTIENNFFTDFHQGMFICDEKSGSVQNLTIRNNVFWGQTYTPPPGSDNYNGIPSWGICIAKSVGATGIVVQNNLIYNTANLFGIRAATTGSWTKNIVLNRNNSGTVYNPSSTTPWSVTIGNWRYSYAVVGQTGYVGSDITSNPSLRNISSPLGADGKPMTSDDGWLPTNTSAVTYGPQLAAMTPLPSTSDTTAPEITLNGYTPMTLPLGTAYLEPAATAVDDEDGEVVVSIGGTVNTGVLGTNTRTYTARDSAGNTATKNRTVYVVAVSATNTPPTVSVGGPAEPIKLASGATEATFKLTAIVRDAEGPLSILWMLPDGTATSQEVIVSQPVGTATYYCTVTDGGRLTATDSLEVTVLTSSGTTTTSLLKQWVRVRTFDMNGVLTGYAWVPGVTQSAQPTTAP